MPDRDSKPKRSLIYVIGSGDSALMTTLAHLKGGYDVHIYTKTPARGGDKSGLSALRQELSGFWRILHKVGEFSNHPESALWLTEAARWFHKLFPKVVFLKKDIYFLISKAAQAEGIRTTERQLETYKFVAREAGFEEKDLFTSLDPKKIEERFAGSFAGGVCEQGEITDPAILSYVMVSTLKAYIENGQLTIFPGHEVNQIERMSAFKFKCTFQTSSGLKTKELSGILKNCTGVSVTDIAEQLEGKAFLESYKIRNCWRGMAYASGLPEEFQGQVMFGLGRVGPRDLKDKSPETTCGMVAPIGRGYAYVYVPSGDGCHLPDRQLTADEMKARKKFIEKSARETYGISIKVEDIMQFPFQILSRKQDDLSHDSSLHPDAKEDKRQTLYRELARREKIMLLYKPTVTKDGIEVIDALHQPLPKGTLGPEAGIRSLLLTLHTEVLLQTIEPEEANSIAKQFFPLYKFDFTATIEKFENSIELLNATDLSSTAFFTPVEKNLYKEMHDELCQKHSAIFKFVRSSRYGIESVSHLDTSSDEDEKYSPPVSGDKKRVSRPYLRARSQSVPEQKKFAPDFFRKYHPPTTHPLHPPKELKTLTLA